MSDGHLFDEELLPVKIKETKGTHQGNAANTATNGSSKNRKRIEGYIEDKKSRTDCRYKTCAWNYKRPKSMHWG